MRVSFEWLGELADLEGITARQAADLLTMAGFTVDSIEVADLSEIVVGRVISQEPHPRSRNPLWVHQVDLGTETRQVIAGAPNAVPGTLVPVALPGTTVPNGRQVRDAVIAGVAGQGMLCSREELLLGQDTEPAILILEEGEPGWPLSRIYPTEAVFEVEVTPNRPDCLGHLGLARELAAAAGRSLRRDFMPPFTAATGTTPAAELVDVAVEAPDLCRRYIAGVVTGIRVGPSPRWMQRRLRAAGVRPISNVVDVTQYVMLEYGQPLHAFDLGRLAAGPDGRPAIRVRRARPGESLLCLDGVTRSLDPSMLVIADAGRPVALAGIMGGEDSAVGADTSAIVLEAATFDGVNVRATSRALRLRTDASSRFEKKLSPELALAGARRAAALLAELAGGTVHREWPDVYPEPQEPVRVHVHPARVDALLGVHVPLEEGQAMLRRLDFQVRVDESDGAWDVLPPVFRLDVSIPEDVVEEIARIHGVDRIPATIPGRRSAEVRPYERGLDRRLDPLREAMTAAGLSEAVTPALVPGRRQRAIGMGEAAVALHNAMSEDMDTLRTSLLPSLLDVVRLNRDRGRDAVGVFETARAFLARPGGDGRPDEPYRLGAVLTAGVSAESGRAGFLRLRAALDRGAHALSVPPLEYRRAEAAGFHPGRCAAVVAGGATLGHLGELHPALAAGWDLPVRAVALEIDLEPLLAAAVARTAPALPRLPAVGRDLNVVVDEAVESARVLESARAAGGELLEQVVAFDEYRGAQVGAGEKSLGLALTFRAADRTLTDTEVDEHMSRLRAALAERHGARFRA